jgi:hypothetical protein
MATIYNGDPNWSTPKEQRHNAKHFEPSPRANSAWEKTVERYRQDVGDPNAYLPDDILKTTDLYKENVSWAKKSKKDGYTVVDIGNPNNLSTSRVELK